MRGCAGRYPKRLPTLIAGRTVDRLRRRGKYLLWEFAHGTLISHLGMSGAWRVWPRRRAIPPPGAHDHVDILFVATCVRLTDPRRFGALLWHDASEGEVATHPLLVGLGLEPFDPRFTGDWLYRHTRSRTASIKQVLLAGDVVVGVGNIYASESLFRARINPKRSARRIGLVRYEALATAVREVSDRSDRRRRQYLARLRWRRRRRRVFHARRACLRPRRGAMPRVRDANRTSRTGATRHLLLSRLPTAVRKDLSPELTQQPGVACPFG